MRTLNQVSALLNTTGGAPYFFGVRSETEAVYELLTLPASSSAVPVSLSDGRTATVSLKAATISNLLRSSRRSLQQKEWLSLCIDVGETLNRLHSLGLLHNDVKSNNVLVSLPAATSLPGHVPPARPVAKLADFGMATRRSKSTMFRTSSARPFYAPELRGKRSAPVSRQTDAYSFGYLCEEINKKAKSEVLGDCAKKLLSNDPKERITIENVCSQLQVVVL